MSRQINIKVDLGDIKEIPQCQKFEPLPYDHHAVECLLQFELLEQLASRSWICIQRQETTCFLKRFSRGHDPSLWRLELDEPIVLTTDSSPKTWKLRANLKPARHLDGLWWPPMGVTLATQNCLNQQLEFSANIDSSGSEQACPVTIVRADREKFLTTFQVQVTTTLQPTYSSNLDEGVAGALWNGDITWGLPTHLHRHLLFGNENADYFDSRVEVIPSTFPEAQYHDFFECWNHVIDSNFPNFTHYPSVVTRFIETYQRRLVEDQELRSTFMNHLLFLLERKRLTNTCFAKAVGKVKGLQSELN